MTNWATNHGVTYPVLIDPDRSTWNKYGLGYIPHNVVLDPDMIVRYTNYGYSESTIINTIETWLPTYDCQAGDVNMDGRITPQDALCAFRIFLNGGMVPPDDTGCNTNCAVDNADVSCVKNGVTPEDALCIFRAFLNHREPPIDCCP